MRIAMMGVGALGSRIALELGRLEVVELYLFDDDKVEEQNVGISVFERRHVGMWKTDALADMVWNRYRTDVSVLDHRTVLNRNFPCGLDLYVVTFDNAEARNLVGRVNVRPVVQVGLGDATVGSVVWNEKVHYPYVGPPRGENPICTHELGAPIVRSVSTFATWSIENFLRTKEKVSAVVRNDCVVSRF